MVHAKLRFQKIRDFPNMKNISHYFKLNINTIVFYTMNFAK